MCSAVNKKALDQYVNFSEQRDELARRRDESRAAEAKIQQLITTLDMRKDEAIERTFKVQHRSREVMMCRFRWCACAKAMASEHRLWVPPCTSH